MNKEPDYSKMTSEDFDNHFEMVVSRMSIRDIRNVSEDIDAILREELNNDVLASWRRENPPEEDECPDSPDGKHHFTPDIELDGVGDTINCEHCGEPQL